MGPHRGPSHALSPPSTRGGTNWPCPRPNPNPSPNLHRWYDLAASAGHAAALNNLGSLYEDGRGVAAVDEDRAARLYRLAATKGHAAAAFNLACLYRDGRVTTEGGRRGQGEGGAPGEDQDPGVDQGPGGGGVGGSGSSSSSSSSAGGGGDGGVGGGGGGSGGNRDTEEAERWLRRAAELGLPGGVRRRLAGRWLRRRWAWVAAGAGLLLEHAVLSRTLSPAWSAALALGPLALGAAAAALASRVGRGGKAD